MKPEHAAHLQKIADLDGGHDDDYCRRDSCWDRQAGVIACFLHEEGGEDGRCRSCDHLPECHEPNRAKAKADRDSLFRKLTCGHPVAQIRLHPYKSATVICDDCGDTWSSAYEQERRAKMASRKQAGVKDQ